MELALPLLTIALGFLLGRLLGASPSRRRRRAGRVLATLKLRHPYAYSALVWFAFVGMVFSACFATFVATRGAVATLAPFRYWLVLPSLASGFSIAAGFLSHGLGAEVILCEGGVAGPSPWTFLPWRRVKFCRRLADARRLRIKPRWWFASVEYLLPDDRSAAAWGLLPRFVTVLDESGHPLPADPDVEPAEPPEPCGDGALRPLQFRLRTLLILAAMLSGFFSWVGVRYREGKDIDEAIADLQPYSPSISRWGEDVFMLSFESSPVKPGDEAMPAIARLHRLESLWLDGTDVTDAGLAHLGALERLDCLHLDGTKVSDVGLAHLTSLERLGRLYLDGTRITDAGLAHLASLKHLEALCLRDTRITDAGLAHLQPLRELSELDLANTRITDAGLAPLRRFEWLWDLNLSGTQITDAGLAHLGRMEHLKRLDLSRTRITDAGLEHLRYLRWLQSLDLSNTQVTEDGRRRLRKVLPVPGLWDPPLNGPHKADQTDR